MRPDLLLSLEGDWEVERLTGLLPTGHVRKRIHGGHGKTILAGTTIAHFAINGTTLSYAGLPINDDLVPISEQIWHGTGRLMGASFCSFRLIKRT
jgi:hypothetical protein